MGDELAWKLNGHLAATIRNFSGWSAPRRLLEAEDCVWRRRPRAEDLNRAARRPAHVARVTAKLAKIFPGLK